MKKEYVIVDLDGTLADCSHRSHLAQAGVWGDFHALAPEDKVIESTATALRLLQVGCATLMVTGRPDIYIAPTFKWLMANKIHVDHLMMRGKNDYRPDTEVKLDLIDAYFGTRENALARTLLCLDDRDKVVEAYRNAGFICWQVQAGAY